MDGAIIAEEKEEMRLFALSVILHAYSAKEITEAISREICFAIILN